MRPSENRVKQVATGAIGKADMVDLVFLNDAVLSKCW